MGLFALFQRAEEGIHTFHVAAFADVVSAIADACAHALRECCFFGGLAELVFEELLAHKDEGGVAILRDVDYVLAGNVLDFALMRLEGCRRVDGSHVSSFVGVNEYQI